MDGRMGQTRGGGFGPPLDHMHDSVLLPAPGSIRLIEFDGGDASSRSTRDLETCRAIRRSVFIDEQGVPEALEWDGLDPQARHFLALGPAVGHGVTSRRAAPAAPIPLGTARMRIVGGHAKAERVAVQRAARQLGVGRLLMLALEAHARREGLPAVLLHAQLTAIPFYERLGYRAHGVIFPSAGIDHREMTKLLV